jgi:hypothetical protein
MNHHMPLPAGPNEPCYRIDCRDGRIRARPPQNGDSSPPPGGIESGHRQRVTLVEWYCTGGLLDLDARDVRAGAVACEGNIEFSLGVSERQPLSRLSVVDRCDVVQRVRIAIPTRLQLCESAIRAHRAPVEIGIRR